MSNTSPVAIRGSAWRWLGWGGALGLLLLPLVAMQFSDEVRWSGSDFLVFGTMLGIAGGSIEVAVRMSTHAAYRCGAALAALAGFLLVWINLAVGIVGSEDNPINRVYFAVLAIGMLGAVLARFRARGMARALLATALAQVAAALIVLLAQSANTLPLTLVFTLLWLFSAALFRRAARDEPRG